MIKLWQVLFIAFHNQLMLKTFLGILLTVSLTSCSQKPAVQRDVPGALQQFSSKSSSNFLIGNWPMRTIQDHELLSMPLPNGTEFHSIYDGIEVDYNYWVGAKKDPDNNGFVFTVSRYISASHEAPEGYLYDANCKKNSTFSIEAVLRDNDIRVEKVKTDCGGIIMYFVEGNGTKYVVFHEQSMPSDRLVIIEEILKKSEIEIAQPSA